MLIQGSYPTSHTYKGITYVFKMRGNALLVYKYGLIPYVHGSTDVRDLIKKLYNKTDPETRKKKHFGKIKQEHDYKISNPSARGPRRNK